MMDIGPILSAAIRSDFYPGSSLGVDEDPNTSLVVAEGGAEDRTRVDVSVQSSEIAVPALPEILIPQANIRVSFTPSADTGHDLIASVSAFSPGSADAAGSETVMRVVGSESGQRVSDDVDVPEQRPDLGGMVSCVMLV
jgi:hypothetical protein